MKIALIILLSVGSFINSSEPTKEESLEIQQLLEYIESDEFNNNLQKIVDDMIKKSETISEEMKKWSKNFVAETVNKWIESIKK